MSTKLTHLHVSEAQAEGTVDRHKEHTLTHTQWHQGQMDMLLSAGDALGDTNLH